MRHYDRGVAALLGDEAQFVIFASYGNDSVALIQLAAEQRLENVVVLYSDTGWASPEWRVRVEDMEAWVHDLGFYTARTTSIGFKDLARQKKGFPSQRYQWCSFILKIEPAMRWLAENDPDKKATCLVGVRRSESQERAAWPSYLLRSENHGGRVMVAPLADFGDADRDALLKRAGVEPLPHRSLECSPCINSNRKDLRAISEDSVREVEALEGEMGVTSKGKPRTLFRPARYGGAVGIREVVRWAHSPHGKYEPAQDNDVEEDIGGCNTGWCGI